MSSNISLSKLLQHRSYVSADHTSEMASVWEFNEIPLVVSHTYHSIQQFNTAATKTNIFCIIETVNVNF